MLLNNVWQDFFEEERKFMSKETKHFYEPEILSALVGLLVNFTLIAMLVGFFCYLYTQFAGEFVSGFVEISRSGGNGF